MTQATPSSQPDSHYHAATPPVGQGGMGKFIFGLVLGLVVGGLAGAFLSPLIDRGITNDSARFAGGARSATPGAPVSPRSASDPERRTPIDGPADGDAPSDPPVQTPGGTPVPPPDAPATTTPRR